MPASPITRSTESSARPAAFILVVAVLTVLAGAGTFLAIRANDDDRSAATAAPAPEVQPPDFAPDTTAKKSEETVLQIVIVSSEEHIATVGDFPGLQMPGVTTEFLVVNDEVSENILHEMQVMSAELGGRPTVFIDFRQ